MTELEKYKAKLKRLLKHKAEEPNNRYNNWDALILRCKVSIAEELILAEEETGWIPVSVRLPEDIVNPITRDAYVYPVTVGLGGVTDIRYYSFCRGHWYNQGPKEMDELVIAWQERPEPYKAE